MKVKSSIKKMCSACYITKYNRKFYVRCTENPRHKQRQKFSTTTNPLPFNSQPTLQYQTKPISHLLDMIV